MGINFHSTALQVTAPLEKEESKFLQWVSLAQQGAEGEMRQLAAGEKHRNEQGEGQLADAAGLVLKALREEEERLRARRKQVRRRVKLSVKR